MSREEKRSLAAVVTQLAGSGALFIAAIVLFGFLSLRAHENMLGLPVSTTSSYLDHVAEGARFVVGTFLSAAFLAVCAIALLPLVFIWSWLQRRKLVPSEARIAAAARRPLVANALLLPLLLAVLWLCLGPLEQRNLLFRGTPRVGSVSYFALETAVLLCLALSIAVIRSNRDHRYGAALSAIIGIVLAALILLLPIDFGILAIPTEYSRVHSHAGAAIHGEIYFIGFDARGNCILYDRTNRAVTVTPSNGSIVLGEREDIFK